MSTKHTSDDSSTETGTAVTEPSKENGDVSRFADRFGKRQRVTMPDPFPIAADTLAGVRLFESREHEEMAIKFNEKPSPAVLEMMHEARWKWQAADKVWTYPVEPKSAMTTRIEAEQLYQEVRNLIRKEKGLEPEQELPF